MIRKYQSPILAVGLVALVALACNISLASTPTPIVFPTPDLTMTAVFLPTLTSPPLVIPTATLPVAVSPTQTSPPPATNTLAPSATATQPPPTARPPNTATPTKSLAGSDERPKFKVEAVYLESSPDIDASLEDWNLDKYIVDSVVYGGSRREGEADLSGRLMIGWDEKFLYLGVRVIDDKYVQNAHRADIYKGDSLEILLDTDVSSDYYQGSLSGDDFQLGISPGSPEPGDDDEAYLWFPSSLEGREEDVKIASRLKDDGYLVEVAIPWSVFDVDPEKNLHLGFCFSISDNDDKNENVQQSMVSNVPIRMLTDPTTWGDLKLIK